MLVPFLGSGDRFGDDRELVWKFRLKVKANDDIGGRSRSVVVAATRRLLLHRWISHIPTRHADLPSGGISTDVTSADVIARSNDLICRFYITAFLTLVEPYSRL